MIKRVVVSGRCLPPRSPLLSIAVMYLLLDRYDNCPDWAWGVFWTLAVITYLAFVAIWWEETPRKLPGFGKGGAE